MNSFFGHKISTSSMFDAKNRRLPVTLIKAEPLTVKRIMAGRVVCELPRKQLKELKDPKAAEFKVGDTIKVTDIFKAGDKVKVTGRSKGRGYAGVMKRHGFHGVGGRTHGQSDRQRHPGSIGMRTTPGRLWKGKRMAGHYGLETITIRNLQVVKVEDNQLVVSGTVPGSRHTLIQLTKYGQN